MELVEERGAPDQTVSYVHLMVTCRKDMQQDSGGRRHHDQG